MKKKQVIKVLGVVVIIGAVAGTTAFAGNSSIKVTTQQVTQGNVVRSIEVEGHIETEQEKAYYAQVTAPVAEFDLKAGDVVKKGDKLVTYDTQDYDRSVEQAQLQAKAAQAGYAGSAAQSQEMTQAYEEAQAQEAMYQQAYEGALENVNDLQYNIAVVADAVDDKRDAINRDIAQVEIEIAQKNAKAADYDDEDRNDYLKEAAQLQIKLATLKKKLLDLPDSGAKPIEDRYFNEAQYYLNELATQRSQLQQEMLSTKHAAMNSSQLAQLAANAELAKTTVQWNEEDAAKAAEGITADVTGVVSGINVEEGAYVAEGTRLFSVKDMEHVMAVVEVTSYEMGQVEVGQKATVEAAGVSYEGTVSKIRRETITDSQNKAKLQVEIHIENPCDKIYLGTDVDAVIQTGESDSVILLPNDALYTDDNGDYCYLLSNGVIEKRYLTCGIADAQYTEVIEGLSQGDKVITEAMTDANVGKSAQEK